MLAVEFQHPLLLMSLHRRLTPTCIGSTGAGDITEATISNSKKLSGAFNNQNTNISDSTVG
jgi:hypothetical protein